jgi:hypothetical protein
MRYVFVLLAACGNGGGGGGDDVGTDATSQTSHSGYLQIQSYDAENTPGIPTRGGTAGAGFWASGAYCTQTQKIDPCMIYTCVTSPPASVSGGTVTITGAAQMITLTPNAMGQYETFMVANPLFNGGEMITFTTSGAMVPAVTKTITAPAKAMITAPAKPPMSSPYLVISRGQDFTVSWSGGGSGKVQVALNSTNADQRVFCRFNASAGTGKLPSAAISTLAAGTGGFAMAAITEEQAVAGDWGLDVSAYFNAVWPDNSIVSGPTMLQ